jgi:hypothetical protein
MANYDFDGFRREEKSMSHWTFAYITDIHVGSPRSYRYQPAWNENWQTARRQIIELNPDFLLLGGDLARDGNIHRYELEAVKADLDRLPFPYHTVPGNMDTGNKHTDVTGPFVSRDDVSLNVQSEQLEQFCSVFGPSQWTFVHQNVRFSGFCELLAGSGLRKEKALWKWLEAQTKLPKQQHHVWVMHSALFIEDLHEPNFDIRDPKRYHDWYFGMNEPYRSRLMEIFKATGTDLVLSGHVHCRKTHYAEGIRFDIGPTTAEAQWADRWPDGDPTLGFLKYAVTDQGIEGTFVPLEKVSTAKGYGPGGHPLPDQRDYSIASEKPSLEALGLSESGGKT